MDGKIKFEFDLEQNLSILKPKVYFKAEAFVKMQTLVSQMSQEIAWHGIVDKISDELYIIEDIEVYPQTVTGTTVDTDQVEYSNWLMAHPDETFFRIRLQGHSHVNMGTSPSGTDENFYNAILQDLKDDDFYIFLIMNKRGDINIWIHDVLNNTIFENKDIIVDVLFENGNSAENWGMEVIEQNVKKISYQGLAKATEIAKSIKHTQDDYYGYSYNHGQLSDEYGYEHWNKKPKGGKGK